MWWLVENKSFDRPSDRDTERQTSKQTAKPTGRHKGRARGGAKWQLGREMSDFSALWHSCSRLSVKRPPGDSGDMTNDKRSRWSEGNVQIRYYLQYLMLMFHIILYDQNTKVCFLRVKMCASLVIHVFAGHSSSCMLKSVFSVFTSSEALSTSP